MSRSGTFGAPLWRLAISAAAAMAAAFVLLASVSQAEAKTWIVKGAGFGHGVGMSQYGAYGYTKHGFGYQEILQHYYTGTTIGTVLTSTVRVLLAPNRPTVSFSGATLACGQNLTEGTAYAVKRKGSRVLLLSGAGRRLASCGAMLTATGGDSVNLVGRGAYHGALEIRPAKGAGLNAINAVDLESYVRGVVPKESPPSWPLEALKAQAVAARSYALSTPVHGPGFDQYADTRSQVYGGASAETASTDLAVAQTALEVVLYQSKIAETFFFSTSGGQTENNENSFVGGTPLPYLRGVPDPYEVDANSPYHAWTRKFSAGAMQSKLGRLVKGRLRNIVVTQRGVSPRIVKANLVGTGGTKTVSGADLRTALGLPDSWAYFTNTRALRRKLSAVVQRLAL